MEWKITNNTIYVLINDKWLNWDEIVELNKITKKAMNLVEDIQLNYWNNKNNLITCKECNSKVINNETERAWHISNHLHGNYYDTD